jgi:hypothetical protein
LWQRQHFVPEGLLIEPLPGIHETILQEPGVQRLADRLNRYLEERLCLDPLVPTPQINVESLREDLD